MQLSVEYLRQVLVMTAVKYMKVSPLKDSWTSVSSHTYTCMQSSTRSLGHNVFLLSLPGRMCVQLLSYSRRQRANFF